MMAHKRMVRFVCDCCKKEFDVSDEKAKRESPLITVEMPSKNYDCEGRHYKASVAKAELCGECFSEYWQYVQAKYAVADYFGVTIERVQEVR